MKARTLSVATSIWLAWTLFMAGSPEKSKNAAYQSNRAVVVVTGVRLNEDPADYREDWSVAEGAAVKVIAPDGTARERKTSAFSKTGKRGGQAHFTADFEIDLDTSYDVTMTFKDGTVIRIADYRLPAEWKTHFYFHSTTGTLSPSSILRMGEDTRTGLRCYVYAVYPLESYHVLGGRQIP
jgi:hypothetical protein